MTAFRQLDLVAEIEKSFPEAWEELKNFHLKKGIPPLPSWPDWCFVPIAAGVAVASQIYDISAAETMAATIVGIETWRITKGIYSIDADVRQALMSTPITGPLPVDVLYHLPEWCLYIEVPDHPVMGSRLHGTYVWLEWDANSGRHELRLILDDDHRTPMVMHLIPSGTIEECLQAAVDTSMAHAMAMQVEVGFYTKEIKEILSPILALVLYLCSDEPDLIHRPDPGARPGNPRPKKIKKGLRIFAAENPRVWEVGSKIGQTLRSARERDSSDVSREGRSPAPHIRRAHWHTYWVGRKETPERRVILKWIHPIFVGAS
ncbi:MAG: hypothetical protein HQL73_02700 [Magnetococcales bacterium]|nr:hypothetical protein [Magnetococcales bacterium]